MKAAELRIQVLYSAFHPRCGYRIACTHPRVFSHADPKSLYADMATKGKLQTTELYCHHCAETLEPTHIDIIEEGEMIVSETEIHRFDLGVGN